MKRKNGLSDNEVIEKTRKVDIARRKALLKKINYDPKQAAKAWSDIAGVWENRIDIDAISVRKEAWLK